MNRTHTMFFVLAFFLVGPAPGEVGACSEDFVIASAEQFCIDRGTFSCQRELARGELDEAGRDACLDALDCEGIAWQPGCAPTERQTEACIDALRSTDRLSLDESELTECSISQTLCPDAEASDAS